MAEVQCLTVSVAPMGLVDVLPNLVEARPPG